MKRNTLKDEHVYHLKSNGIFHINCRLDIFTDDERGIINQYGYWFKALSDGVLEPITEKQRRFVKAVKEELKPESLAEIAWVKYLGRTKYEEKYGDKYAKTPDWVEDTFYSREQAKQHKSLMFKVTRDNHRK